MTFYVAVLKMERFFFKNTFKISTKRKLSRAREKAAARATIRRLKENFDPIPPAKGGSQAQKTSDAKVQSSYSLPTHPIQDMMSAYSHHLPGTLITLLTAALACPLNAAVISVTRPYTDATSGAAQMVSFDRFDTSLGTLTGITLAATGAARGSFQVHNMDNSEILTLNGTTLRIRATLTGENAPVVRITGNPTPTTTSPGLSYDIDPSQLTIFTLSPSPLTISPISTTSLYSTSSSSLLSESSAAYFTGPGTVNFSLSEVWATNITGGDMTQDYTGLLMSGDATLQYVYDPTPVPEPGTWIMSTLLVTGIGAHWWRRRKRQKYQTSSPRSRISHGQSSRSGKPSSSGRVKIRHLIKLD